MYSLSYSCSSLASSLTLLTSRRDSYSTPFLRDPGPPLPAAARNLYVTYKNIYSSVHRPPLFNNQTYCYNNVKCFCHTPRACISTLFSFFFFSNISPDISTYLFFVCLFIYHRTVVSLCDTRLRTYIHTYIRTYIRTGMFRAKIIFQKKI